MNSLPSRSRSAATARGCCSTSWVNDSSKQVSMSATLEVGFEDGSKAQGQVVFTVMPKGSAPAALVADPGKPAERSRSFAFTVRVMNGGLTPLVVSQLNFDIGGLTADLSGSGWTCGVMVCGGVTVAPQSASPPITG